MSLDLTSVRAKLIRSQEHTQAFKNELFAWTQRHPYSLIQKRNPESTRYSLILFLNEPPPFQRWSLMMADAFSNLRMALDHLVYTIAAYESAPNPPANERSLQFPITDSRVNFDSAVIDRKQLGTISDPIRTAIEAAQPYNRPHNTVPPLLALLRDLVNADKHKLLQLTFSTVVQGDIGFIGEHPQDGRVWTPEFFTGEIQDGTEVVALVCDRPAPNMHFDRHIIEIVVAIRHNKRDPAGPDWSGRTDVGALFMEISREVRRIIYDVAAFVK